MKNQLTTSFSSESFSQIKTWFNAFVDKIETSLSATENLHILAIIIGLVAVVTVFCLGLYIVIRTFSLIFFRKKSRMRGGSSLEAKAQSEIKAADDDSELENTFEEELQEELSHIENNSDSREENPRELASEKKEDNFTQEEVDISKEEFLKKKHKSAEKQLIELDWKKTSRSQRNSAENQSVTMPKNQTKIRKSLHDLVGMIVNMVGRNIDELKIAQALMYRCMDDVSEETVLQIVRSVKEFLVLCNQGAFDNVRRMKDLPSDEDCILHLIAGDTSYAMALMEALMDDRINQAVSMKNMVQREALFRQSSNYACYFGTLAEINDVKLASASFELAVEMYPENPLAWSRCADLYKKIGMEEKASWAYNNVLKLAKQGEDKSQEANARKSLSQYLYAQGEGNQASQLYMESKNYYDSIGINRPLDRKELEIIELIDRTENKKIIESVLSHRQNVHQN